MSVLERLELLWVLSSPRSTSGAETRGRPVPGQCLEREVCTKSILVFLNQKHPSRETRTEMCKLEPWHHTLQAAAILCFTWGLGNEQFLIHLSVFFNGKGEFELIL